MLKRALFFLLLLLPVLALAEMVVIDDSIPSSVPPLVQIKPVTTLKNEIAVNRNGVVPDGDRKDVAQPLGAQPAQFVLHKTAVEKEQEEVLLRQRELAQQQQAEAAKVAQFAKQRAQLTLRVAGGQWLPDAIRAYLDQQAKPMDLEWNAPSQFRMERGIAQYADSPQEAVFAVVRHYGLSVCVWQGNVKPVLEIYQATQDEDKCRDQ